MPTPAVPFPGFCGVSYQFEQNRYAAIERTVNFFLLANESQSESKWKFSLQRSPGNKQFGTLPVPAPFNQPSRGLIEYRGQVYGVNGDVAFAIDQDGNYTQLFDADGNGYVQNDLENSPITMTANANGQIYFAASGFGYVIEGQILTRVGNSAAYCTFQDGYVIVILPDSNTFQISGNDATPIGNAKLWDDSNVLVLAGQADRLAACISRREYLRIFGNRRSEIFTNVGANGIGAFPFQNYNSTFIETGIAAPNSLSDLGDSYIWIGQDERGQRACWRDASFSPQRISTFAVEQFWQSYSRVSDARAFSFIWQGHLMWQVSFPSAIVDPVTGAKTGRTWIYDVTVSELVGRSVWIERSYQTPEGQETCRPEQTHCFGYGKHLVGSVGIDGNPGAIYEMSPTQYADCGVDGSGAQAQIPIICDRICPHLYEQNVRIAYDRIDFDCTRGVGLSGLTDDMQPGADPQLYLRWSNDAGNTYGIEYNIPVGKIGEFGKVVNLLRLGYGRDRVFWIRYSDPTNFAITGANLTLRPGAS